MSGMRRSMITTSGRRRSVSATADAPSVASPMTRIRGERESARRSPSRTTSWSSAMRQVISSATPAILRGARGRLLLSDRADASCSRFAWRAGPFAGGVGRRQRQRRGALAARARVIDCVTAPPEGTPATRRALRSDRPPPASPRASASRKCSRDPGAGRGRSPRCSARRPRAPRGRPPRAARAGPRAREGSAPCPTPTSMPASARRRTASSRLRAARCPAPSSARRARRASGARRTRSTSTRADASCRTSMSRTTSGPRVMIENGVHALVQLDEAGAREPEASLGGLVRVGRGADRDRPRAARTAARARARSTSATFVLTRIERP